MKFKKKNQDQESFCRLTSWSYKSPQLSLLKHHGETGQSGVAVVWKAYFESQPCHRLAL